MNGALLLRAGARVATCLAAAAGVIAANPSLVSAAMPPQRAALATLVAIFVSQVMHELAHTVSASNATAPAVPATPDQESHA